MVGRPEDLTRTRAPRIVKLHGSIEQGGPFILAAEDYRTYPQTHGAFVNFARQTFIENDLCLLGFSGDDPNFLAWAGWVRDHLGELARRIYLVGALNLSAAKRRYLEAQNIVPIDIYAAVKDRDESQRHEEATQMFLGCLRNLRLRPSHDWQPGKCPVPPSFEPSSLEEQTNQLRACVTQWQTDRESYPGWLICPGNKRRQIRHATTGGLLKKRIFSKPSNREQVLSILHAVRSKAYKPTSKQARDLFDTLSAWRSVLTDSARRSLFFPLQEQVQLDIRRAIGQALSEALAPFLAPKDRTASRAQAVWDFITESPDNAGLSALLPFLTKFPEWRDRISQQILKNVISSNTDAIRNSYYAVQRWVGSPPGIKRYLPRAIVNRLISMIEVQTNREMPMLLDTVCVAIQHKILLSDQLERLESALQDLQDVMQYEHVEPQSKLAVDISLIRCAAVRLASIMKAQGSTAPVVDAWLLEGDQDVLPEVRYCREESKL